jgi:P27 family predicted phage terminase small subunit
MARPKNVETLDFHTPKNMHPTASRFIKTILHVLKQNNLLENVDGAAITMLAVNYSTFIKASEQLEEEGLTVFSETKGVIANPLIKIAKDAQVTAMTLLKEFGLTARSRTKLQVTTEDDSPLANFIKEVR